METRKNSIARAPLFGPVPSRRLGRSLGIDLVAPKTCSLDCVYCESGPTTLLTTERREFVPTEKIVSALRDYLGSGAEVDYVTFSGAGEPPLHSGIGRITRFLREEFPEQKICLLTNATTLIFDDSLFDDLKPIHLLVPSLDASTPEAFERINRPARGITLPALIEAITKLRKVATGAFHLEIFVVPGINDSPDSIAKFAEIVDKIKPDKTLLNTLDRPGAERWVEPASKEKLSEFQAALAPFSAVEIIGRPTDNAGSANRENSPSPEETRRAILEITSRRPCTVSDIAQALGQPEQMVARISRDMIESGVLTSLTQERGVFMRPAQANEKTETE